MICFLCPGEHIIGNIIFYMLMANMIFVLDQLRSTNDLSVPRDQGLHVNRHIQIQFLHECSWQCRHQY